jgi:hypothetical protein
MYGRRKCGRGSNAAVPLRASSSLRREKKPLYIPSNRTGYKPPDWGRLPQRTPLCSTKGSEPALNQFPPLRAAVRQEDHGEGPAAGPFSVTAS